MPAWAWVSVVGGVPCYFDCANEAGLAIAGLNFPGYAQFAEAPEEGAVNVAAYEFPLWVAASFSTVAEVREALKGVVIVAKAPSEGYGVAQLHWLVGDGKESIVIECQADGMHVYDDGLDVLTNQPPFPWHTENVRNYMHIETAHPEAVTWTRDTLRAFGSGAGMIGFPGGYDPASRFVRAAFLNAHYPAEEGEAANVTRLFRTLEGASMCKGGAQMADGRSSTPCSPTAIRRPPRLLLVHLRRAGAPERVHGRLRPERHRAHPRGGLAPQQHGRAAVAGPMMRLLTGASRPLE